MKRILLAVVLASLAWVLVRNAASAQDAGAPKDLPTAPGAHKAVDGGLTQAPASLLGNGASPLEPYLITWLLPVAGLVCAVIAIGVDRRMRASGGR